MEVPDCGAIYENPGTHVPYLTLRLFLIGSGGNPEHSASGVTETVPLWTMRMYMYITGT